MNQADSGPVIVFDGVCVFCSRWVGFLLAQDRRRLFRFAAMQTLAGRTLLADAGIDPDDPASFILVAREGVFRDSGGVAEVLKRLAGPWPLVGGVIAFVPRALRDSVYFWIARNRYKLFGRRETCYSPTDDARQRFMT